MRGLYACFQVGRARASGISDIVKGNILSETPRAGSYAGLRSIPLSQG